MRILSVTAQKPDSTGSGVYLSEVVRELDRQGHEQAVLAGVYQDDQVSLPEGTEFFPVFFHTERLPFAIPGMSDQMPYESTVYSTMDSGMTEQYMQAFCDEIRRAADRFRPDLVLCHHLYLVTALVRECLPGIPVFGFCHNTDLRQMRKHDLKKAFIREQISRLDGIFALHQEQKKEILQMYPVRKEQIYIAGTGYNSRIFFRQGEKEESGPLRLVFAGKISREKGAESLIRSLSFIDPGSRRSLEAVLAGGNGNQAELERIRKMAVDCPWPVRFTGKLSQEKLAEVYRQSDIFVLPSFYEGLPLTVMEAMACGCKVVVTDLPGIRPFMEHYVRNAPVCYVRPPRIYDTDRPDPGDLPAFEKRLAEAVTASAAERITELPDLSGVSWKAVCGRILRAAGKE